MSVTVLSAAQQAANLRAKVTALQTAGVLDDTQARVLNNALELKGTRFDVKQVKRFLTSITKYHRVGVLNETQSDELRELGYNLRDSVKIR